MNDLQGREGSLFGIFVWVVFGCLSCGRAGGGGLSGAEKKLVGGRLVSGSKDDEALSNKGY